MSNFSSPFEVFCFPFLKAFYLGFLLLMIMFYFKDSNRWRIEQPRCKLHRNLLQYLVFTSAVENKTLFLIVKHTSTNGFMWKYSILLVLTILSQCLAVIRKIYLKYQYNLVFISNTLLRIKIVFLNFNDFLLGRMVSTVVCHG